MMDVRKQCEIMVILATTFHHKTHLCRDTKGSDEVATILFLVYPYKWVFLQKCLRKLKQNIVTAFFSTFTNENWQPQGWEGKTKRTNQTTTRNGPTKCDRDRKRDKIATNLKLGLKCTQTVLGC